MNVVHLMHKFEYVYKTHFGKQETRDVIINYVSLRNVVPWEEYLALEKGFALDIKDGKEIWYMSRNTRIWLKQTDYKQTTFKWEIVDTPPKVIFEKILKKYIHHNNFKNIWTIKEDHERYKYILYYENDKIVAITKLLHYKPQFNIVGPILETNFFIWNYHKPELNLGIITLEHEIALAKSMGLDYLYTGPGYEQSSIYKSTFKGFQWFTGMEWSTNVEKYKLLCRQDSDVRSFKAYSEI